MDNRNKLPRKPTDAHHSIIVGQNGTGKTAAGVYQLAFRSWHRMPWLIFNYKRDEYLEALPGVRRMDMHERIPKEPGLYMLRPKPLHGSIDHILEEANARGRVGLYIDEGLNVGEYSKPFRVLLTQGRSKRTPVIFLTQRPKHLGMFPLTECKFFQVFFLQAKVDRATISEYAPLDVNYPATLGEHESYYYDSEKRRLAKLAPVPFGDEVLDIFDRRRSRRFQGV